MVLKGTAQTGTNSQIMAPPPPPSPANNPPLPLPPVLRRLLHSFFASGNWFDFAGRSKLGRHTSTEPVCNSNCLCFQFQSHPLAIRTPSSVNSAGVSPLCNCIVTIPIPISKNTFLQQKTFSIQIADSCNSLFWVLIGEQKKKQPLQSNPTSILGNNHFRFRKYLFPFWEIPISLLGNPYFTLGSTLFPFWEIPASALGNTCFQCLSRVKPDENKTWTAFFYLHLRQSLTKARDNASCQHFFHVGNVSGLAVPLCKGPLQVPLRSLQWDPAPRLHRRNMTCLQTVS